MALDGASGLCFLHELQPARVHRDVKSANLLVAEDWTVKVADFGSGALIDQLHGGTRAAAPPRQSRGWRWLMARFGQPVEPQVRAVTLFSVCRALRCGAMSH